MFKVDILNKNLQDVTQFTLKSIIRKLGNIQGLPFEKFDDV